MLETVGQTKDLVERKFLLQFLTSPPKELPKQSVKDFLVQLVSTCKWFDVTVTNVSPDHCLDKIVY